MGNTSFRLRLSTAKAKFVREPEFCPAGRALGRSLIDGLADLVIKSGDDCRGRHCHLLDGDTLDCPGLTGSLLQLLTRASATAAKFRILPIFNLADRTEKNQECPL